METDKIKNAKRFLSLRKKLNLTQQEMSELFGVHLTTWQEWEYGLIVPFPKHMRLLEQFEQNPPKLLTIPDMCRVIRSNLGLRKFQMATLFGVQPNTWGYWEKGEMKPSNEFIKKIKQMYKEIIEKEPLQKAS